MSASAASAADPDGPAEGCKKGSENAGFFARLWDSYRSHLAWDGADPNAPGELDGVLHMPYGRHGAGFLRGAQHDNHCGRRWPWSP